MQLDRKVCLAPGALAAFRAQQVFQLLEARDRPALQGLADQKATPGPLELVYKARQVQPEAWAPRGHEDTQAPPELGYKVAPARQARLVQREPKETLVQQELGLQAQQDPPGVKVPSVNKGPREATPGLPGHRVRQETQMALPELPVLRAHKET